MKGPVLARTDDEIGRCFSVVAELRPHLQRESFIRLVRSMEPEGYRLAYIEVDDGAIVAAAGYRIFTSLFMGRNLYVDDLVTAGATRSKGYGRLMLDWLRGVAKEQNCTHLHLDSGTQRHRAHRFYLREGLDITSFHFSQKLDAS